MKKLGFVGVLVFGLVITGLMIGGGTGCSSGSNDPANIAQGKSLMADEKGEQARDIFSAELDDNADSCNGLYGRILADIQFLSEQINDLLATGGGSLFTTGLGPQAMDLNQMLNLALEPFLEVLIEMEADTDRAAELNCTFRTDSYPVTLYADASNPLGSAVFSGVWDKIEVLMIGSSVHMLLGLVDFVSAHNLTITSDINDLVAMLDVEGLLDQFQGGIKTTELIYQVRSLGQLIQDNQVLLTKGDSFDELMAKVPEEWAEGFSEYDAIFDAIEEVETDPSEAIIGIVDDDNNGLDAGDEMSFGLVRMTSSGGTAVLNRVGFIVPDILTATIVADARDLLGKARAALEAAGEAGTTDPDDMIGLGDLNPILTVFSDEIGGLIPSTTGLNLPEIPSLPDIAKLDLKAFFTDPKPLRDFLPVTEQVQSGAYELAVEGEIDENGNCASCGSSIVKGDASHFQGGIAADCIAPLATSVVNPIPYIKFSDPSFNGLLWINLDPVEDNTGSCSGDPTGFNQADQYSLNKLIAFIMVSVTSVPEFTLPF